jgi:hypothetical protein
MMTPAELANQVEALIDAQPPEVARYARIILRNRLAHPEIGVSPRRRGAELSSYRSPPPSTGDCAANREPRPCYRCGSTRARHDIDGQRWDCDGYL